MEIGMAVQIWESLAPLSEEKLCEVENRMGFRLPTAYRSFLLKYNGGKPKPAGFRFDKETDRYNDSEINFFYGIQENAEYHINFERNCRMSEGRMPSNIIPIASDPFGNRICISISGEDCGHVYFWDHEREADPDEDEVPDYSNLHLIATSFDQFLASLFD
jgi:cell wall assembly regulator SMI1